MSTQKPPSLMPQEEEVENIVIPIRIAEDGTITAEGYSTPHADKRGLEVHLPPKKVIPIVFLPGIMGTHLKLSKARQDELKKGSDISWRPDDKAEAIAMIFNSPAKRQMILDPDQTDVDRYDPRDEKANKRHDNVEKVAYVSSYGYTSEAPTDAAHRDKAARLRGWSEVFFSSYGKLLNTLEQQLNMQCWLGKVRDGWKQGHHAIIDIEPETWGGQQDSLEKPKPLKEADLKKTCQAWYPVHAMGYNWLKSNGDGGKEIAQRIRSLIADYQKAKFDCNKVIVVTHSMGGLVARALIHPDYGNALDIVAGIVHGAMPTTGAPAAYKRMRAGFEGDFASRKVIGDTGPRVTAVMANSPGSLQLLPNETYAEKTPDRRWLQFADEYETYLKLPESDPYQEIYTETEKWYRLIEPEWVNPAKLPTSDLRKTFAKILRAKGFHQDIANTYHPITYLTYGAAARAAYSYEQPTQPTWQRVVWNLEGMRFERGDISTFPDQKSILQQAWRDFATWEATKSHDDGSFLMHCNNALRSGYVRMQPPRDNGDETVPEISAYAPVKLQKIKMYFKREGYDHQNSYQNNHVINATLYSICKIALGEFDWWEEE